MQTLIQALQQLQQLLTGQIASAAQTKLRANDTGDVNLATEVIDYLESLSTCETGACVKVSLSNFTNACKQAGCDTKNIFTSIEVPLIAGGSGKVIPLKNLFYLWYSRSDVSHWLNLPKECRGGGAPGALLYADLVQNRALLKSKTGWPSGLLPGAFLQLWSDEFTYHRVRDVGGTREFGHSCIFRRYEPGNTTQIVVSDQGGLENTITYPYLGLDYVIGANLRNAELIT